MNARRQRRSVPLYPARGALEDFDRANPRPMFWLSASRRRRWERNRQPLADWVFTCARELGYSDKDAQQMTAAKVRYPAFIALPIVIAAMAVVGVVELIGWIAVAIFGEDVVYRTRDRARGTHSRSGMVPHDA